MTHYETSGSRYPRSGVDPQRHARQRQLTAESLPGQQACTEAMTHIFGIMEARPDLVIKVENPMINGWRRNEAQSLDVVVTAGGALQTTGLGWLNLTKLKRGTLGIPHVTVMHSVAESPDGHDCTTIAITSEGREMTLAYSYDYTAPEHGWDITESTTTADGSRMIRIKDPMITEQDTAFINGVVDRL